MLSVYLYTGGGQCSKLEQCNVNYVMCSCVEWSRARPVGRGGRPRSPQQRQAPAHHHVVAAAATVPGTSSSPHSRDILCLTQHG